MHAYSWVVTDIQTEQAVPTAIEMTAACLSMEAILDAPGQERVGWYVIGGRWSQKLAPGLADNTPLPHDMQNKWWTDVSGNVTVVRQLDPDERGWPADIFTPTERLHLMNHVYDIFRPPDPAKITAGRELLTRYPDHIIMAVDIHD